MPKHSRRSDLVWSGNGFDVCITNNDADLDSRPARCSRVKYVCDGGDPGTFPGFWAEGSVLGVDQMNSNPC